MAEDQTPQEGSEDDAERNWKALRERNEKLEAEAAKAAELERKVAFMEAGIDTGHPVGKMLLSSYDGELTAESVIEAAKALDTPALFKGQASTQTSEDNVPTPANPSYETDREHEPYDHRDDIASGSLPGGDRGDMDPRQRALATYDAAVAEQHPRDKAVQFGVSELIRAGATGDKRVILGGDGQR